MPTCEYLNGFYNPLRRHSAPSRKSPLAFERKVTQSSTADDRACNHAAFWDGKILTLSPAYDICPQGRNGYEPTQAMLIDGDKALFGGRLFLNPNRIEGLDSDHKSLTNRREGNCWLSERPLRRYLACMVSETNRSYALQRSSTVTFPHCGLCFVATNRAN